MLKAPFLRRVVINRSTRTFFSPKYKDDHRYFRYTSQFEDFLRDRAQAYQPDLNVMLDAINTLKSKKNSVPSSCYNYLLTAYTKHNKKDKVDELFSLLKEQENYFSYFTMLHYYVKQDDVENYQKLQKEILENDILSKTPLRTHNYYHSTCGRYYGMNKDDEMVEDLLLELPDSEAKAQFLASVIRGALDKNNDVFAAKYISYCLDNNLSIDAKLIQQIKHFISRKSAFIDIQNRLKEEYVKPKPIDSIILQFMKPKFYDKGISIAEKERRGPDSDKMTYKSIHPVIGRLIKDQKYRQAYSFYQWALEDSQRYSLPVLNEILKYSVITISKDLFDSTWQKIESEFAPNEYSYFRNIEFAQETGVDSFELLKKYHNDGICTSSLLYDACLRFYSSDINRVNEIISMMKDANISFENFTLQWIGYAFAREGLIDELNEFRKDYEKLLTSREYNMMLHGFIDGNNFIEAKKIKDSRSGKSFHSKIGLMHYLSKHPDNSNPEIEKQNFETVNHTFSDLVKSPSAIPTFDEYYYYIEFATRVNTSKMVPILWHIYHLGIGYHYIGKYKIFEMIYGCSHGDNDELFELVMKKHDMFYYSQWCNKIMEGLIKNSPDAAIPFITLCNKNNVSLDSYSSEVIEWVAKEKGLLEKYEQVKSQQQ